MYDNATRGNESPERQAESTDNYPVCPECGAPILALTTSGPSEHFFEPCGCRASLTAARELNDDAEPRVLPDGGVSFTDLHAFERDLLYAIRALEGDEPPKGLAVKSRLEDDYGEEINHSRLYQNLDRLIERGLVTKGKKDDRTNEYATTAEARDLLERQTERRVEQIGLASVGHEVRTDGGRPASETERVDHEDIAITDDGDLVDVTRIHYHRYADRTGVCPFCRSEEDVEFVDEVGTGGTYRKQRFECACGAFGDGLWTWKVGTIRHGKSNMDTDQEVRTDGGLAADNVVDLCDLCEENQGVSSEDVVNDATGEMATVWLCSECLDRMERYNQGEEDAFEDVLGGEEGSA